MSTTMEQVQTPGPGPTVVAAPATRLRRSTSSFRTDDLYGLAGAFVAALSLTTLVYTTLAPFSGPVGFVVVTWLVFVAIYALLGSVALPAPAVKDKVAAAVVHSIAFVFLMALLSAILYTVYRGVPALSHLNFFTDDMSRARPTDTVALGLTKAGVAHGIVATLEQIAIAVVLTVPVGLACAVFLSEIPGRFSRIVRTVTEAMTALPSIIAGLFIYATYILTFHLPKSGLAAALALSVMMLPIIIRSADVVLRLVPGTLKEASLALGAGQWRTVWQVTLPTARSGLATAVILGMARGLGETSPVLLTAGFGTHLNVNPLTGPQPSLPLLTLKLTQSPSHSYVDRGFGAAVVLMALELVLFVVARLIGGRGAGNLSKRQQARARAASRRDLSRWERKHVALSLGSARQRDEANVTLIDPPETPS
jgi:phosphate transport system permease protein